MESRITETINFDTGWQSEFRIATEIKESPTQGFIESGTIDWRMDFHRWHKHRLVFIDIKRLANV